jgi:pyruvate formate lyase activating enzyme
VVFHFDLGCGFMTIAGMVKSSLVDYPGLISCVLFVPGCNYNCFYCHNRPIISGAQEKISLEYIYSFLESRIDLLDAVVVSGGESTLQNDLIDFLTQLKEYGFKLKLDTNGSNPHVVSEILEKRLCDYFAVDYKAPLSKYSEIAGNQAAGENVLKTISLLMEHEAAFEVRTTVYPQLCENDLIQMAKELPCVPRYVLNRYRKPEEYLPCDEERISAVPYTQNQIQEMADKVRQFQPNVVA